MSVDHDLLADYVGGALEGTPERERVAHLIATSPEWGRAADELTAALVEVQNDLNLLRHTPEPMPEDLAARFDGLFDGPRRDPLEARVVDRRPRAAGGAARAKRWKRWAAPVAIVAAVLGFLALGRVPALVAPAMDGSAAERDNAQLSGQAPGVSVPLAPMPVPTVMSGRSYDRGNLGTALAGAGAAPFNSTDGDLRSGVAKADATSSGPLQRLTDPVALQQCLNAVSAVQPGRAELVEYAYFEGSPALVISITSTDGQWRFVAGANCGPLGPDERFRTPLK